jgi:hypothetical protein
MAGHPFKIRILPCKTQSKTTLQLSILLPSMVATLKIRLQFPKERLLWDKARRRLLLVRLRPLKILINLWTLAKTATVKKEVILHHLLIEVLKCQRQLIRKLERNLPSLTFWTIPRRSLWVVPARRPQSTKKSACHPSSPTIAPLSMVKAAEMVSPPGHQPQGTCRHKRLRTRTTITIISRDSPRNSQTTSRLSRSTSLPPKSLIWVVTISVGILAPLGRMFLHQA